MLTYLSVRFTFHGLDKYKVFSSHILLFRILILYLDMKCYRFSSFSFNNYLIYINFLHAGYYNEKFSNAECQIVYEIFNIRHTRMICGIFVNMV